MQIVPFDVGAGSWPPADTLIAVLWVARERTLISRSGNMLQHEFILYRRCLRL